MLKVKGQMSKKVGFIGLGKMGSLMVQNLLKKKFRVVVFDTNTKAVAALTKKGARGAENIASVAQQLTKPRIIWLMVPHGKPVDVVLQQLMPVLERGDIVIDGGNSFYENSIKRAKKLKRKDIFYCDVGVSGGLKGAAEGASIMIGGEKKAFQKAEPLFRALAQKDGYAHMGPSGAGHFVKMVHNGIEYALLQGYGEGYQVLEKGPFQLDMREVTRVWRNGSVIRSWLLDLAQEAFDKDPELKKVSGIVCGGSTGQWTTQTAKKMKVATPTIERSLKERYRSRTNPDFSSKIVAIMRRGFGGHKIPKKGEKCD